MGLWITWWGFDTWPSRALFSNKIWFFSLFQSVTKNKESFLSPPPSLSLNKINNHSRSCHHHKPILQPPTTLYSTKHNLCSKTLHYLQRPVSMEMKNRNEFQLRCKTVTVHLFLYIVCLPVFFLLFLFVWVLFWILLLFVVSLFHLF